MGWNFRTGQQIQLIHLLNKSDIMGIMPSQQHPATSPSGDNNNASSETTQNPAAKVSHSGKLIRAASLIAFVTILSKVLGFLRDWKIMNAFGASLATDAYFAAFQIPSFAIILLGGLGGPFHTATVAVFSRMLKEHDVPDTRAKQLANTFITLTSIVFVGLSVLVYMYAEPIMRTILSSTRPELVQVAAAQLRIMSPVIWIGGLVGIFYGLLNVYNSFFWPSFSPAALSIVMLIALFVFPHGESGMILAWSTLVGGIFQLLLQLPVFFKQKFSLKPDFQWNAPELKQIGELLFPAIIGTSIGQMNVYVDMFFTKELQEGGWAAIVMGNRLIQLPIGVLQTALLVPIFPLFSRYVVEQNFEGVKRYFKGGVISLWFISIPILVLLLWYGEEFVRLLFQHGSFDAEDTQMVSTALLFLAFSMLPYFARDSITRVFYAFQDSRTPLIVGLIAIGFNYYFDWLLVGPLGVGGIALSTTLVTLLNMTLLGVLSKRHISDLGFKEMVIPFIKLLSAGVVMVAIMVLLDLALQSVSFRWLPIGQGVALVKLLLTSTIGTFIYLVTALAFKVEEVEYLFETLLRKLFRR